MEYSAEDEAILIQRTIQGETEGFASIVSAYQRPVFNLCWRMLGETQSAKEAAQEAFLKAHKNLDRYEPGRKFLNWILTIASNHCIDYLRRRSECHIARDMPIYEIESSSPEQLLIRSELENILQNLLAKLGELDRSIVILFYWFNYSYREIAQNFQTTESAIKSRLYRSRRSLTDRLKEIRSENTESNKRAFIDECFTFPSFAEGWL